MESSANLLPSSFSGKNRASFIGAAYGQATLFAQYPYHTKGEKTMAILENVIIAIGIVGAIVSMSFVFKYLRKAMTIRTLKFERRVKNSDEQAILNTLELIKEAENEIEIFDDGDCFPGSAYEDDRVIEAIEDKLKKNPAFKFRFLFNIGSPELKLIQAACNRETLRGIELYRRISRERPADRHYRIIDGGVKGILSEHSVGKGPRTYQNFDCRAKADSDRKRAGSFVFEKWGQNEADFERIGER